MSSENFYEIGAQVFYTYESECVFRQELFSYAGGAFLSANAILRESLENSDIYGLCKKCQQATFKKLDSVFRMKIFFFAMGVSVAACISLR